ncbi:MAG: ubiquinol-cytochrome c reductase iron-sulfur subunit [Cyanobacteria bacterium P01_G01_bin.38]
MDRREFMTWIGVGSLAASLPVAIAACNPGTPPTAETDPTETDPAETTPVETTPTETADAAPGGPEAVGTVADLDANGQILNESAGVGPVLIVRPPDSPDEIVAVNPKCTHQGCNVDWKAAQGLFVCPCHSSLFAPDGAVTQGPAGLPLATYTVEVDGESILVSPA